MDQSRIPNYILIGMPASGKSSMGRNLARLMDRPFVDTDLLMAEQLGYGPGGLLEATETLGAFVRQEEAVVLTVQGTGQIIATGGSVVYSARAMQHLHSLGLVIYLFDYFGRIQRRVGPLDRRGVVGRPGQRFYDVYRDREQLYRHHADLIWQNCRFGPARSAHYLAGLLRFMEETGLTAAELGAVDLAGGSELESAMDFTAPWSLCPPDSGTDGPSRRQGRRRKRRGARGQRPSGQEKGD